MCAPRRAAFRVRPSVRVPTYAEAAAALGAGDFIVLSLTNPSGYNFGKKGDKPRVAMSRSFPFQSFSNCLMNAEVIDHLGKTLFVWLESSSTGSCSLSHTNVGYFDILSGLQPNPGAGEAVSFIAKTSQDTKDFSVVTFETAEIARPTGEWYW